MNKVYLLRPVALLLLLLATQIAANAQTGNISGTVTESSRKLTLKFIQHSDFFWLADCLSRFGKVGCDGACFIAAAA